MNFDIIPKRWSKRYNEAKGDMQMSILEALKTAAGRIKSGEAEDEAKVKQWVIVPILRALNWDDSKPEFVPEFAVGKGKVDYALCQGGQAMVFIEAKRPGAADAKGEEQLFQYASNRGVPFLILTDGDVWDFYLSMAEGVPASRRFYHAELHREENLREYADIFNDYLQKKSVVSGSARQEAEKMHESNRNRGKARTAISGVWRDLLQAPDDIIRDLVAEETESKCGVKPDLDDVEEFLRQQADTQTSAPVVRGARKAASRPSRPRPTQPGGKIVGFELDGEPRKYTYASETLAEILKEFQWRDKGFMARFAPKVRSKRRQLVAEKRDDLYTVKHLITYSIDMENGWWLGTNISSGSVRRYAEIACEVAGVKFGSELKFIEQ